MKIIIEPADVGEPTGSLWDGDTLMALIPDTGDWRFDFCRGLKAQLEAALLREFGVRDQLVVRLSGVIERLVASALTGLPGPEYRAEVDRRIPPFPAFAAE